MGAEDDDDWEVPADAQPQARDYRYDLEMALDTVVALSARIPADAYTAQSLGTERSGNAVVIGPGSPISSRPSGLWARPAWMCRLGSIGKAMSSICA